MAEQQGASKCSRASSERSWLRHQTLERRHFVTDEKGRIYIWAISEQSFLKSKNSENSVLLWHNNRSLIALEIMVHTASGAPVGLLNEISRLISYAPAKIRKKKSSVWFTSSPLLLLSNSLGLVVWTAASHGFLLARSRGCSLLEHRKRWCVVSHMPRMSPSEDDSELFNNALMDRTTGNPLS